MRPSAHSPNAAKFRRTRAAHRDETAEDYAEAVAQLIRERGAARVRDLAKLMGVSHVTVTKTLARLSDRGVVVVERYQPVTLTRAGQRLAARCAERHTVVLAFLRRLGVSAKQAEIDAEGIEHHVSAATVAAMRRLLEQPGASATPIASRAGR